MQEFIMLGPFGGSILLSVLLRMIYSTSAGDVNNRWKSWIAAALGIGLGIVAMYYNLEPDMAVTFQAWVNNIAGGFVTGAGAVGFYEMTKKA